MAWPINTKVKSGPQLLVGILFHVFRRSCNERGVIIERESSEATGEMHVYQTNYSPENVSLTP